MNKLTHRELVERQKNQSVSKLPFAVVLNNIRSLYNVGSIFRTCDGAGVERLWLCGITGTPESERERIEKTALGAEKTVPWKHSWDILPVVRDLKKHGYQIVLLEQIKQSVPYQEFEPKSPVCLIVGNEIDGISDELLNLSDASIEIEMAGIKNSLNVTVAFGVVAYHIRNRLLSSLRGVPKGRRNNLRCHSRESGNPNCGSPIKAFGDDTSCQIASASPGNATSQGRC